MLPFQFNAIKYCAKKGEDGFTGIDFADGALIRYKNFIFTTIKGKTGIYYALDEMMPISSLYYGYSYFQKAYEAIQNNLFPKIIGPFLLFRSKRKCALKFSWSIYRQIKAIFHHSRFLVKRDLKTREEEVKKGLLNQISIFEEAEKINEKELSATTMDNSNLKNIEKEALK